MRASVLVLLLAVLTLSEGAGPTSKASRKGRHRNKGGKRCKVAKCKRCARGDQNICELCHVGFALTEDQTCGACGLGCQSCEKAGVGNCDKCKKGYTLWEGSCQPCAPHCDVCNTAGPGKCNECKDRHYLTYRLTHDPQQPEVHECLPCGLGCKRCTYEEGCQACDLFYSSELHGQGCTFSWWRVMMAIGAVIVPLCACIACCAYEDTYDAPHTYQQRPRRREATRREEREEDRAEVVARGYEDSAAGRSSLQSRRGGAAIANKPLAHALREGSGRDSWREVSREASMSSARLDDDDEYDDDGPGAPEPRDDDWRGEVRGEPSGSARSAALSARSEASSARSFGRSASSDDDGANGGATPGGASGIDDLLQGGQGEGGVVRRGASLLPESP